MPLERIVVTFINDDDVTLVGSDAELQVLYQSSYHGGDIKLTVHDYPKIRAEPSMPGEVTLHSLAARSSLQIFAHRHIGSILQDLPSLLLNEFDWNCLRPQLTGTWLHPEPPPGGKENGFNPSVGGMLSNGWFCNQSLAESPPRIDTMEEMESKTAVAFKPFEEYIKCLASGKLDGYLDLTRREDKVTVPGVSLLKEPFLLLHHLGRNVDMQRIKNLFIRDTVCVASTQL